VLGWLETTGVTENDVRKLSLCPAAQPPVGQLPGDDRINPSTAARVDEKLSSKNAAKVRMKKNDIQVSFRIRF